MSHNDNILKATPTSYTPLHFPSDTTVLAQRQTTLFSVARSIIMLCAGQLCHQKQYDLTTTAMEKESNQETASCDRSPQITFSSQVWSEDSDK